MYSVFAPLVGALMTVMNQTNSRFSVLVGSLVATLVIHIAGLAAVSAVLLAKREEGRPGRLPFYYYLGGFVGVGTVFSNNYAFAALGASLAVALALLGQTLFSIAVDATGLLGRRKYPLSIRSLPGICLALAGVAIMVGTWRSNALAMLVAFASGALPQPFLHSQFRARAQERRLPEHARQLSRRPGDDPDPRRRYPPARGSGRARDRGGGSAPRARRRIHGRRGSVGDEFPLPAHACLLRRNPSILRPSDLRAGHRLRRREGHSTRGSSSARSSSSPASRSILSCRGIERPVDKGAALLGRLPEMHRRRCANIARRRRARDPLPHAIKALLPGELGDAFHLVLDAHELRTQATRQIAEGRFETRVAERTRDELGDLGRAVNQMAARWPVWWPDKSGFWATSRTSYVRPWPNCASPSASSINGQPRHTKTTWPAPRRKRRTSPVWSTNCFPFPRPR